jgi:hypothetical protein
VSPASPPLPSEALVADPAKIAVLQVSQSHSREAAATAGLGLLNWPLICLYLP